MFRDGNAKKGVIIFRDLIKRAQMVKNFSQMFLLPFRKILPENILKLKQLWDKRLRISLKRRFKMLRDL